MTTVATRTRQGEENNDHRPGVIKTALKTAVTSAGGIASILAASAFGAIPTALAITAVAVFGLIMIGALTVCAIYVGRR
ncbi:hypothetical protein [Actinoplanes sp. CA-252034]|uniref:hypothetical protein n=1 Tax=Actinoplanes sp. CA-252034 TaxID=3239906 RepID=UPI003D991632